MRSVRAALLVMGTCFGFAVWSLLSAPSLLAFILILAAVSLGMFWDRLRDFWESQEFFDE